MIPLSALLCFQRVRFSPQSNTYAVALYLTTKTPGDGEPDPHQPRHKPSQPLGMPGLTHGSESHSMGDWVLLTISLRLCTSLCVDPDDILRATGSDKGPAVLIFSHQFVDLGL